MTYVSSHTAGSLSALCLEISKSSDDHAQSIHYMLQLPEQTTNIPLHDVAANNNTRRMRGFSDNMDSTFNNTTSTRYETLNMWRVNNILVQKSAPTAQITMNGFNMNSPTLGTKQISKNIIVVPKDGAWETVRNKVVPLFS